MEVGGGGVGGGEGDSTSNVLGVRGRDGEDIIGAGQETDENVLELHVELGKMDCLARLGAFYRGWR